MGDGADRASDALHQIYRRVSPARRRQLPLLLGLMLLGAMFELLTIGAVVPLLSVLGGGESGGRVTEVLQVGLAGFGQEHAALRMTLLFAILAVVGATIRVALAWFSQKFAFGVGHDMAMAVFARMLRQPYAYYVQTNSSTVISGIEKVQIIIYAVILPAIQSVVAAVMALFVIALLVVIDPFVAAVAFGFMGLIYIAVSLVGRRALASNSRVIATTHKQQIQQVQEGLGGIRDILLDRSQGVFEAAFQRTDRSLRNAQATNVVISTTPRFAIEGAGIVLIAGLALYLSGRPGGMIAAIPVLGALALGAQRLLPLLHTIYLGWSHITGSMETLFDVVRLLRSPVAESGSPSGPAPRFQRQIAFRNLSFRHAGASGPTLSGVDLTIGKGETLGIMGPTGSGKSTLLDLLMGLLEPSEGELCIDGVPLSASSLRGWQAQIAHVPQTIYLADSSIASNIAFGAAAESVDMGRVRQAAEVAQLSSFIDELPDGYSTRVGERGIRLSGGQRQRIGLARALYKGATVLILDEATSALDDATEQAVLDGLRVLGDKITLVMVAHRRSSLARCDRIVKLRRGRIEEVGGYDEIVGR